MISPDTTYRWNGGIGQDKFGDIAVGYAVSSLTVNPGIRYSGHAVTDHVGVMEPEITVVNGTGSQTGTNKNWSSFSTMSVDPVDDCTFYYTNQYYATSSQSGWGTQIEFLPLPELHELKPSGDHGAPQGGPSVSCLATSSRNVRGGTMKGSMHSRVLAAAAVLATGCVLILPSTSAAQFIGPDYSPAVRRGVSPPLRDLKLIPVRPSREAMEDSLEEPAEGRHPLPL